MSYNSDVSVVGVESREAAKRQVIDVPVIIKRMAVFEGVAVSRREHVWGACIV